ncbi:hypothetical protein DL770_004118 [Monosporascus sp. CRB-9-2]|nr:hypothetical protein DL770_004118 [Monosporascus sp. CRB-9-2]
MDNPIASNMLGTAGACKYYCSGWRAGKATFVVTLIGAIMGGVRVGLVSALRKARREHVEWPMTFKAVPSPCCWQRAFSVTIGIFTKPAKMSGTHGMGGVYEDQDQRNFPNSSIKEEHRTHNINVEGYLPKDKPRAMNEIRSQEIQTATEERHKNDPLSRAQAHGNKPSRGAMADADIQADEEEMLKKK